MLYVAMSRSHLYSPNTLGFGPRVPGVTYRGKAGGEAGTALGEGLEDLRKAYHCHTPLCVKSIMKEDMKEGELMLEVCTVDSFPGMSPGMSPPASPSCLLTLNSWPLLGQWFSSLAQYPLLSCPFSYPEATILSIPEQAEALCWDVIVLAWVLPLSTRLWSAPVSVRCVLVCGPGWSKVERW